MNYATMQQGIKYLFVGGTSFLLDVSLLIIAKEVVSIPPTCAIIFIQVVVLLYNFLLNKYWSFQNTQKTHRQFVRYMSLAGVNYIFGVVAMYVGHDVLSYDYRLVRVLTVAVTVLWNFVLYKFWVYKKEISQ